MDIKIKKEISEIKTETTLIEGNYYSIKIIKENNKFKWALVKPIGHARTVLNIASEPIVKELMELFVEAYAQM